jgi:hypothetical protein
MPRRLTTQETALQKAQTEAIASAGKASGAADIANKAAASMTDTLNSERQMSAQMRALITPRVLTDVQISDLAASLSTFKATPYCVYVNDDTDSKRFVMRLLALLEKAGWTQKAPQGITGFMLNAPGKQPMAVFTSTGLSFEIAESARQTLGPPILALMNGLRNVGIAAQASATPDDQMAKNFDPKTVHIFVGARG